MSVLAGVAGSTAPASGARDAVASENHPSILDKAFGLLLAFNSHDRVLTLSELSRASGLPKSTVHRLIARLERLDAIERHGNGYKLGIGLVRLGASTLAGHLRDVSLPYLTELHRWSGHAAHLAVLRGAQVVYLERVVGPGTPAVGHVGGRAPAHRTAIGRALLAFAPPAEITAFQDAHVAAGGGERSVTSAQFLESLRRVRGDGYAHERDEIAPGLSSIAAPIVPGRYANAAISLVYPSGAPKANASTALRETAAKISQELRATLSGEHDRWLPPDL